MADYSSWKFSWSTRTDMQGYPAGIYTTTPFPIDENSTEYTVYNDENPTGKTFTLGTKYYVDGAAANDLGDGSWATPFKTIQHALTDVTNGNKTIIVRGAHDAFDGVYHESNMAIKYGTDDTHRYMLVGYKQERPTIDADGADVDIFVSTGASSFPSAAYFTFQRLKLYNTQGEGMQLGTLNSGDPFTERKRDMYVNLIDMEGYLCGCEVTNASSGSFYFMNADNVWIYHCTSGHTYSHAYKIGDGSRNSISEWNVAYEFGYWSGVTTGSAGHPSGFDYPDCGYNHELRYCIGYTGLFYIIQVRGNNDASGAIAYEPNGIGLVKIHHNEIYDSTHFDDVEGEQGHISPCQVLLYTAYDGCTPANEIYFYGNIIRDASDAGCYGVYVAGSCNCEKIYIYNNLIYGNDGEEIYISNPTAPDVYVYNNTIYDDDDDDVLVYSNVGALLDMKNNIMYQAGDANCVNAANSTHTYNRYYTAGAGSVGVTLGDGEADSDPGLEALPVGAYSQAEGRLLATLPGTDLSVFYTTDANSSTRSAWDMGWLEYSSPANPWVMIYG